MPNLLYGVFFSPNGSDFYKDEPDVPLPDAFRACGKRGSQAVWRDIARPQALKIVARAQGFVELFCGPGVDDDARRDGYVFKRWLAKTLPNFDIPLHTPSVDIWNMADRESVR